MAAYAVVPALIDVIGVPAFRCLACPTNVDALLTRIRSSSHSSRAETSVKKISLVVNSGGRLKFIHVGT